MSPLLYAVPFGLQGLAMAVDEGWYHRQRGLPRWERNGHPLDTLTVAFCSAWAQLVPAHTRGALGVFIGLSVISCLFVTKDEFVHAKHCSAGEHWLHSVLFMLHPIVLASFGALWVNDLYPTARSFQLVLTLVWALYQFIYWRFVWTPQPLRSRP